MENTQPRNAPCSCGSGKKYKKCHLLIEREAAEQAEITPEDRKKHAEKRQKSLPNEPKFGDTWWNGHCER